MPDDTITLVSTTDSPEQVAAALTGKPAKPATEPAAETIPAGEKPAETPAKPAEPATGEPATETIPENETPEETEARETREASDAGTALNKRKTKIQKQIDELWFRRQEARRDVEAEEARLLQLQHQRETLEKAKPAESEPAKAAAKPVQPDPDSQPEPKLDAVDDKGNAKYATYEDYLSDHAKWSKAEAELAARRVIEQERSADRERIERDSASRVVNERLALYNENLETFKKTHADFDAAVEEVREVAQELAVALGPQALKVIDGYTVFDADDGPALTYYLLKHPDELKAIAMKAPPQQLVHLARLESRIRPATPSKKTGSPAATAPETKAPEPIKPVGAGPTATTVPPDEESFLDYKLRRERELRARRGA